MRAGAEGIRTEAISWYGWDKKESFEGKGQGWEQRARGWTYLARVGLRTYRYEISVQVVQEKGWEKMAIIVERTQPSVTTTECSLGLLMIIHVTVPYLQNLTLLPYHLTGSYCLQWYRKQYVEAEWSKSHLQVGFLWNGELTLSRKIIFAMFYNILQKK